MTCFEDEEDDKNENGDDENKFEAKNSQVTNEWAMSTIEGPELGSSMDGIV